MDPRFKTSFIPKKPIVNQPGGFRRRIDVISLTVFALFFIAIAGSAGLFGYRYWLENKITEAKEQVVEAREAVDFDLLNELDLLDRRLKAARSVLDRHVSVVPVFEFLEDKTIVGLRYTSFSLESGLGSEAPKLTLNGETQDLGSLAAQSFIYDAEDNLLSPLLQDINQTVDEAVTFSLESGLAPVLIKYAP